MSAGVERPRERASQRAPEVWVGEQALAGLGDLPRRFGCRSVALFLDGSVAGYGAIVQDAFEGVDLLVHVVAPGEPSMASVDAAADAARPLDAPLVAGVGGGSALDIAKQVAAVLVAEHGIEHYLLGRRPFEGCRPMVAIPTTSGTGAEATRTCVLTDGSGRKVWTWGDELLPDVVVLDPAATVTMPPSVTTSTGLDAYVHALEAVTGQRRAERAPEPALRALRLVTEHLPRAVGDGGDLDARAGMQQAAFLAGRAIDGCGTGMAHAIGHALGTLHHLPHGTAVAIGLTAALDWNVQGAADVFAPVSGALGVAVDHMADEFRRLCEESRLTEVVGGLADCDLVAGQIAEVMVEEENLPMYLNSCRLADDAERLELAHRTVSVWHELRSGAP